ncbi:MAG: hypothetical protein GX293_01580 [Bacteroidales bacterium]|nr:hypothetical protein [Bacteroidales bacterium]
MHEFFLLIFDFLLTESGWNVTADEFDIYTGTYYKRKLVPDIVMRNNSGCIVFDAKYKRMAFVPKDFDRSDFFQIHTYAGALGKQEDIRMAGLLYPLNSIIAAEDVRKLTHEGFYFPDNSGRKFICEGIYIGDTVKEKSDLNEAEHEFCNRIENLLSSIS